jgi:hypothetical protein
VLSVRPRPQGPPVWLARQRPGGFERHHQAGPHHSRERGPTFAVPNGARQRCQAFRVCVVARGRIALWKAALEAAEMIKAINDNEPHRL